MSKKSLLISGLLVLVFGTVFLFSTGSQPVDSSSADVALSFPTGTQKGELAPDLSAVTLTGTTFQLREHRGKIVVLNAFASWCGPCRLETPHLVELAASQQDVLIVGLNQSETTAQVGQYQQDFAVNYPLLLDEDGHLGDQYPIRGLPTTWFLDEDGVIRYIHSGPMTRGMMEQILTDIRAGIEPNPFSG
jgi:thiol-disulfide isomerase/thioredoxin